MGGSLNIRELKKIVNKYQGYTIEKSTFVETGTYKGMTTFALQKYFRKIHTIELSDFFYHETLAKSNKLNFNNIDFHLGDSSKVIPDLILKIKTPIIYFLDGHFCGIGDPSTAKSKKVFLLYELKQINNLRKNFNDIIIIDDLRLFHNQKKKHEFKESWSKISIESVLNCFENKRIKNFTAANDRFIIYLNKKDEISKGFIHNLRMLIKPKILRYHNKLELFLIKRTPQFIKNFIKSFL